jgi:putative Ca2+/H+ antiporter (TMEM165/GDT1 family)
MMPLLSSFVIVALAEMGDKTQLIALTLSLRFCRPWIVMLGILVATIFNHALASAVGVWGAAVL